MTAIPLTTVLIDTYNYGRFIEQAIESVLSQDFPAEQMEVVVVDDGSTDDTAERIGKYGSRIRYLPKENGGQASAFNAGFAQARGELIALLDADDFFLPEKLRRIVTAFQAHPEVGMIYHQLPEMHEGGVLVPVEGFESLSGYLPDECELLSRYSVHQTSCLAFRRSVLEDILPMPESMKIQADAYLELLAVLTKPVLAIPEDLAVYRIHGNNLCATDYMVPSAEGVKRLELSSGTVRREVEQWVQNRFGNTRDVGIRRVLDRLVLPVIERGFQFEAPNRIRYFEFLLRRNNAFGRNRGRFITGLKNITALVALVLNYKNSESFYRWCSRTISQAEMLWRR